MKNKPLKNKRKFANQLDNHKEYGYIHPAYFEEDVKSAVEWLIQKIDDYCIGRPPIAVKNDNTIYTVVDLIKEAFPDLNPSGTLKPETYENDNKNKMSKM